MALIAVVHVFDVMLTSFYTFHSNITTFFISQYGPVYDTLMSEYIQVRLSSYIKAIVVLALDIYHRLSIKRRSTTVEKNVQVEVKSNIWLIHQRVIVRATKQIAYTMDD